LKPSYDTTYCTLEPNPDFSGGTISTTDIDWSYDFKYFNAATKTWNCPWDVNSKSNWLTTDGTKIIVDTTKAPAYTTVYEVKTIYYLWCKCSGSTYSYEDEKSAYFYFEI
jgi:hypothetical protein